MAGKSRTIRNASVKSLSGHYEKVKCPECHEKVKVIKVSAEIKRVGVHATKAQPYIECRGSGKFL